MKQLYLSLRLFFTAAFMMASFLSMAQENIYKVPLSRKVERSSLIVEGRIKSSNSFWDPAHRMIYTSHKVEVYKVFKGTVNAETIEVLTQGGTVGLDQVEASDLLNLDGKEAGVFFCFPNSISLRNPSTGITPLDVYSSAQGFIHYNTFDGTAAAPFEKYATPEKLYAAITALTGRGIENRKPQQELFTVTQNFTAATITSYSPSTVWAGAFSSPANNILTINGSGFGTPTGTTTAVFFPNGDNGGSSSIAVATTSPLMVSWTNTQIQVRVPTNAGSGVVQVRDAAGVVAAIGTVEVLFSALSTSFTNPDDGLSYPKESNLMSDNGIGGYTLLYNNSSLGSGIDLDASPAKATFQRALNTWKEVSGFNVLEGGTTASQAISTSDGLNVAMYDNSNTGVAPLADGTLAVCYSRNSMCLPVPVNAAQKIEFDVILRNPGFSTGTATFTAGPCPPLASDQNAIDLETVILHELGHALNLGHIIDSYQGNTIGRLNPTKLMNYAVLYSVKRTSPDYSAAFGANYEITPQGNTYGSCGLAAGEMIPLAKTLESRDDCPLTFPLTTLSANTAISVDLVHATSNKYVDPAYTQIRCDGFGTQVTNNAYYAFRTGAIAGDINMTISGYTTTPAALAACPTIYVGIPTTGIRFSLYQVNSCPVGQAFPAPVACRLVTGNGLVSAFTGLTANTSYLLFMEGVENTKATFNILFNGSALPVKVNNFTGELFADYNQLQWSLANAGDMRSLVLERSVDGTSFAAVSTTNYTGSRENYNDQFKDYRPFAGTTYYRLLMVNAAGGKEYSNVIALKRNDAFVAGIYPNPAKGTAKVNVSTSEKGLYSFRVYNATGQLVKQEQHQLSNQQIIPISLTKLAKGTYLLKIYGTDNQLKKNISFLVD